MGALQGPVICPTVSVKNEIIVSVFPLTVAPAKRSSYLRSRFWGFNKRNCKARICSENLSKSPYSGVQCSSSMSSNNGSMADSFSENDEDYVNSSVIEAGFEVLQLDSVLFVLFPRYIRCADIPS